MKASPYDVERLDKYEPSTQAEDDAYQAVCGGAESYYDTAKSLLNYGAAVAEGTIHRVFEVDPDLVPTIKGVLGEAWEVPRTPSGVYTTLTLLAQAAQRQQEAPVLSAIVETGQRRGAFSVDEPEIITVEDAAFGPNRDAFWIRYDSPERAREVMHASEIARRFPRLIGKASATHGGT